MPGFFFSTLIATHSLLPRAGLGMSTSLCLEPALSCLPSLYFVKLLILCSTSFPSGWLQCEIRSQGSAFTVIRLPLHILQQLKPGKDLRLGCVAITYLPLNGQQSGQGLVF